MLIDHVLVFAMIYAMMEKHKESTENYKELTEKRKKSREKVVVSLASPKQEIDIHFLQILLNR
jgi:hypothetical protein